MTTTLSPKALKLIRDCIVLLVANKRIIFLKGDVEALRNDLIALSDLQEYAGYRQEYKAVLKAIRDQKMKIDQSWFEYLLELIG